MSDDGLREVNSRIAIHDRMIALSYGHGIGCGKLTDDEAKGLRRLAQMVIRGVTWFEASDFGKPLGWDEAYSTSILESLWDKKPERYVTCDNGDVAYCGYSNAAYIGTTEHFTTSDREHVIYNLMIDGVPSHYERMMGLRIYGYE